MRLLSGHFVGRAGELASLERILDGLDRGDPGAVQVAGEPGIGKTRLLRELAARAVARRHLVLSGAASEFEHDLPFSVFVDAVDEYVAGLEPGRLAVLGGAVQAELAHVFPSLPALAGGQRVSPQQERYRSHRAVRALLEHLAQPRLFRGARGGMLSESVYGRTWHPARQIALSPDLAATPLARRPYDLRHAGLSLWLNATGAPAEIAARAGNSARVLHEVYLHCTDRQEDTVSQRIKDALDASTGTTHPPPHAKAGGYTNRRHHPRPCPPYVREPVPGPAHSPRPPGPAGPQHRMQTTTAAGVFADQTACEVISAEAGRCPDPAHA